MHWNTGLDQECANCSTYCTNPKSHDLSNNQMRALKNSSALGSMTRVLLRCTAKIDQIPRDQQLRTEINNRILLRSTGNLDLTLGIYIVTLCIPYINTVSPLSLQIMDL